MLFSWKKPRDVIDTATTSQTFELFVSSAPCLQNAVDAVPGWSTSLPPEYGVVAGSIGAFHDIRIIWAAECFGSLDNKKVLELGPLEAGHTFQLEQLGANVTAIEANKLAFLRCLIAKEITGLQRAKFLLGDFVKWLEVTDATYDLIVASGVLYHMGDPLHLLDLVSRHSDALYLWTHYVSDDAMPVGDPRRATLADHPRVVTFNGVPIRLYRRTYANAESNLNFNGGIADDHSWMHRDDILSALRSLGYTDIRTVQETPDHVNGPCFSVFARKANAR
jgi:hypothetical protein